VLTPVTLVELPPEPTPGPVVTAAESTQDPIVTAAEPNPEPVVTAPALQHEWDSAPVAPVETTPQWAAEAAPTQTPGMVDTGPLEPALPDTPTPLIEVPTSAWTTAPASLAADVPPPTWPAPAEPEPAAPSPWVQVETEPKPQQPPERDVQSG
jgi:hypothetical protein